MNLPSPDEFMEQEAKRLHEAYIHQFTATIVRALHMEYGTVIAGDMRALAEQIETVEHWRGGNESALVWYWSPTLRFVYLSNYFKVEGLIGDKWVLPPDENAVYSSIDQYLFCSLQKLESLGFKFDQPLKGDV